MTSSEIAAKLREPFPQAVLGYRPQSVKDTRCIALPYIDARDVQDRLDDVVGVENWQDSYDVLNDGSVMCRLAVRIGGEWITKTDVGSPSEQPDGGDRMKAAYCLPLDAMALTANGWTTYDRLSVGDLVLGYDTSSRKCRWTPVSAVNVFHEPCEMWSMNSKSFNMACTPNHRWVVHRREGAVSIKESRLMDSRDRIIVAAVAEGGSHQVSAREAAMIGWLATDGGVHINHEKRIFNAFIHQSKVVTRDSIRELLGSDAVEYVSPPGERLFSGRTMPSPTMERASFRIRTPVVKSLLSKAGLYDGRQVNWGKLTGLVTRLTVDARHAMFTAMMDGDGQKSSASGQLRFGKKRKPGVLEAFEVLATMNGIALGTLHGSSQDGKIPLRTLRENPHTWNKCIEVTPAVPEGSWCPTTDLGTWVTMWSGQITITGNSDALKRTAIKFGIGRYITQLDTIWADYDPKSKSCKPQKPLPPWALPGGSGRPPLSEVRQAPPLPPKAATAPPAAPDTSFNHGANATQLTQPAGATQPPPANAPKTPQDQLKSLTDAARMLKSRSAFDLWVAAGRAAIKHWSDQGSPFTAEQTNHLKAVRDEAEKQLPPFGVE